MKGDRRGTESRKASDGCPEGWPAVGLEEQDDTDPEEDGDPGEEPALLDLPRDARQEPSAAVEEAPFDRKAPRGWQRRDPRRAAWDPTGHFAVVFHHGFGLTRVRLHARRPHALAQTALWIESDDAADETGRMPPAFQVKVSCDDRRHPLRPLAHRLSAYRRGTHGTVQLALCQAAWGQDAVAHRGY